MPKKSRKKTENLAVENASSVHRKIYGTKRREILEQVAIPQAYHKGAVVKRADNGEIHIYYGGIGAGRYHFHGHMIIAKDGQVRYHRLPFSRRNEAEYYSDGQIKRGRKFKRKFCY